MQTKVRTYLRVAVLFVTVAVAAVVVVSVIAHGSLGRGALFQAQPVRLQLDAACR